MGITAGLFLPEGPGAAEERAEHLAALRKQRMLMTGIREEIDASMRIVSSLPPESHWRSVAARHFADRREELGRDLRGALRHAEQSLAAIDRAIMAAE